MKLLPLLSASLLLCTTFCLGQPKKTTDKDSVEVIYKQIDTTALKLEIHYPDGWRVTDRRPAILFFFGGGWNSGSREQFRPQAMYFTRLGLITVLADYRTKNKHQTTPFDAVSDARSAMRFLKEKGMEFGIDTSRIIASGGSAGAHLAAATAMLNRYDDPQDKTIISCKPAALILFNPVIDNGPDGYGYERVGGQYPYFSPMHNIRAGVPPTLFMVGTADKLIPVATAQLYQQKIQAAGGRCDLILYDEQPHGFFNFDRKTKEYYYRTIAQTEQFLKSLGYL